ncbi:MAG: hypothetical protein JWM65_2800 [Sphingomonas bacterium]|nr:hypothetical protein [Sphingomonas bacterium]
MSEQSDLAERIARKRARVATVMAIIFVTSQAASFHDDVPLNRPATLHLAAWTVWAVALLVFLVWGGALFRGRQVRGILNDESTVDHRRRAIELGFWAAIGTAFLVYGLTFIEPVSGREATRLIVTFGVAFALLRFGMLERRALRDG